MYSLCVAVQAALIFSIIIPFVQLETVRQ